MSKYSSNTCNGTAVETKAMSLSLALTMGGMSLDNCSAWSPGVYYKLTQSNTAVTNTIYSDANCSTQVSTTAFMNGTAASGSTCEVQDDGTYEKSVIHTSVPSGAVDASCVTSPPTGLTNCTSTCNASSPSLNCTSVKTAASSGCASSCDKTEIQKFIHMEYGCTCSLPGNSVGTTSSAWAPFANSLVIALLAKVWVGTCF